MSRIAQVVAALVARFPGARDIPLDAVGDEAARFGLANDEVEPVFAQLEARGVQISAPQGGRGETNLQLVLTAARGLREAYGRTPSAAELAAATGLGADDVRQALALAKVLQRR